ncbi:MAG: complex I NDUFA9 subunit family protein [Acidobacteriota bacterium]
MSEPHTPRKRARGGRGRPSAPDATPPDAPLFPSSGAVAETTAPAESLPRRVLLTGATGFIGSRILTELLDRGCQVVAVGRRPSAGDTREGVIRVSADILADGWQRWCEGCEAAIHLVGIIREIPRRGITFDRMHRQSTERVIAACHRFGITRLVHMSALGARPDAVTGYQRSKWAGEEAVRASGLRWTVFRPSVVFGPGDGFTTSLAAPIRRLPVFPVFGDGRSRMQPVAVEEVAAAFVTALGCAASEGREIALGGPEPLAYDDVVRRTAAALGLRRTLLHLPLGISRVLVGLAGMLPSPPITRDQLTMLLEESTCDVGPSRELFGLPVRRFEGPVWLRPR